MKRLSFVSLIVIVSLLLSVVAASAGQGAEKARIMVQFAPGHKAEVERSLIVLGAEFHYIFDELSTFVVSVPATAVDGLSRNPNVVFIEDDVLRYPVSAIPNQMTSQSLAPLALELSDQVVPYGIDMVQARDVWDVNRDGTVDSGAFTGANRKICIIDSGLYIAHEDLNGVNATGLTSNLTWDEDGLGHGTHVAGTIVAMNNALGVVGVTPGTVQVLVMRVFGNDGAWAYSSTLINAAYKCRDAGANIISMSLGGSRSSVTEKNGFATLYNTNGILSIAAAGNAGTSAYSYPASYPTVVSVAAIDSNKAWADFSQYNSQVELAAPGVGVLSTVPYLDSTSLTVSGVTYSAGHIEFSARGTASGALVNGGLCDSVGSWSGKVVLCERGVISFYDKVHNVQLGGGAAAAIYNNEPGNFLGTLGEGYSSTIIGISLSQADGQYLVANRLGQTGTVSSTYTAPASSYEYYDGTSMATPHVSAVAALVWSAMPTATNAEIRQVLGETAQDLGTVGRDVYYGYGLVQAKAAIDALTGGGGNTAPTVTISSPASNVTFPSGTSVSFAGTATDAEDGSLTANLVWTSNLDNQIGTGGSFSTVLSDGTHTITASVTDSGSLQGSASITVVVEPAADKTVTVTSLAGSSSTVNKTTWKATVIATINPALSGAVVSGVWSSGATASCTTDALGQCTVSLNVKTKTGSVTFTVNNVTLDGYTYVPGVTSVTVSKPL